MPLNWQLWDRIRAYVKKANVYRTDNVYQDQTQIDKTINNGDFINFSRQSSLLEQTNLQINRLERYKDYDMMDEVGEISLALDMYADEASLADPERKHSVIVRAKNKQVKKIIEDFLYHTILIDREIRSIVRYLCKYGDFNAEIIPTKNRDGVASFRFMNVYHVTRVQTKFGDLVGYYYQDPSTNIPVFLHPWSVIHMRLTSFDQIYHPYGRSILEGGRKDFKRLRLMEDAALIYRITRAPEKRIFNIPVGNIPPAQVPQYMELLARQMKKYKFVDPATGQVNERYSPLIQEDDFWLPKRTDGNGPSIDTLPGAENLDQIADIEYFKKKMVAGLKIPFARVGIGDQSESDGRSLASVSPEFAKAIQWIQREVVLGLKKLCIAHLAMRGHEIDELRNFDLYMTSASAIDELYRIETWNTRADIINNLNETGMFTPEWILGHFTDMSEEEIEEMTEKTSQANKAGPGVDAPLPMEGLEPGVAEVLVEARSLEERARSGRKLSLMMERRERLGLDNYGAAPDWYINQNELDGLPKGSDIIIAESANSAAALEARKETEALLRGEMGAVPTEINDIASAVEQVQTSKEIISEDENSD
jgi:hypothetical protein